MNAQWRAQINCCVILVDVTLMHSQRNACATRYRWRFCDWRCWDVEKAVTSQVTLTPQCEDSENSSFYWYALYCISTESGVVLQISGRILNWKFSMGIYKSSMKKIKINTNYRLLPTWFSLFFPMVISYSAWTKSKSPPGFN